MYRSFVRALACLLLLCGASPAFSAEALSADANAGAPQNPVETPILAPQTAVETPILVPSAIPVGFLVAWKPAILTVRVDTGSGSKFGSDKLQPFRALGRYTTTFFKGKFLARAEVEGGRFQTDTEGVHLGSDGYDITARLLGGTATQVLPGFTVVASAGFLSRYQHGTGLSNGAPQIGVFGVTSNAEVEYKLTPNLTVSLFVEGGLAPLPYLTEARLGTLSDASEFRTRLQVSLDLTPKAAIDVGYDFTRWHASFAGSTVTGNPNPDQALLLSSKDYALTIGIRWKP
jgi:hypothetical protein